MSTLKPAVLALEDGSLFHGRAFGADATVSGECVFNTSMTGYQEILTDPSYFGQIVTMTAVQIGNYGVNDEDTEAFAPKCSGFVVRELSPVVSNWRSKSSLDDYLKKYGIPGISEIDTRALTKKLRVDGAMKCCLSTLPISDEEAVRRARCAMRRALIEFENGQVGVLPDFCRAMRRPRAVRSLRSRTVPPGSSGTRLVYGAEFGSS